MWLRIYLPFLPDLSPDRWRIVSSRCPPLFPFKDIFPLFPKSSSTPCGEPPCDFSARLFLDGGPTPLRYVAPPPSSPQAFSVGPSAPLSQVSFCGTGITLRPKSSFHKSPPLVQPLAQHVPRELTSAFFKNVLGASSTAPERRWAFELPPVQKSHFPMHPPSPPPPPPPKCVNRSSRSLLARFGEAARPPSSLPFASLGVLGAPPRFAAEGPFQSHHAFPRFSLLETLSVNSALKPVPGQRSTSDLEPLTATALVAPGRGSSDGFTSFVASFPGLALAPFNRTSHFPLCEKSIGRANVRVPVSRLSLLYAVSIFLWPLEGT